MMVTFISQCEKNALGKTRKVLDAFANRIGDNTWQTVITEEGLNAVKKLLRATVSKNTAVACHWIRGRSRSELIWIVGSKDKFNNEGIVPVNTTRKELIMDEIKINHEKILANTTQQLLASHLFAVGFLASALIKKLNIDNENLAFCAFIAGCFHDLGKIDPQFQNWLSLSLKKTPEEDTVPDDGVHIDKGKFSFENHPRHNEISLVLFSLLHHRDDEVLNKTQVKYIKDAIYWHHAKPIRETEFTNQAEICKKFIKVLGNEKFESFFNRALQLLKRAYEIHKSYTAGNDRAKLPRLQYKLADDYGDFLKECRLPIYKDYSESNTEINEYIDEVADNANKNLIRSAVITADRIISSLDANELEKYIANNELQLLINECLENSSDLQSNITSCLYGFKAQYPDSARNIEQSNAAKKLSDVENIAVLKGPAGCGKTKIALEWANNKGAKKIIWVCPRVEICLGLYGDLSQEEYLPNCNIEIYTGEYKKIKRETIERDTRENEIFSGDIVITTIDQVINSIITHTKVTALIDFMDSHVVFDEFHEIVNMPAFNVLFAELIACKKLQGNNANILLVSATPNYFFVQNFLEIDVDDIIGISSFNESKYQIKFDIYDETEDRSSPLINQLYKDNTFVIVNTAKDAQIGFIENRDKENAILIHSKFKKEDKRDLFKKVLRSFKKGGTKEYAVLRSGPIVQASLNITCNEMITEFTTAENWLQRLGRLDRFGTNESINYYTTVVAKSIDNGKQQSGCAKFLNRQNSFSSAKAWYDFLKNQLNDEAMTINQIYSLYEAFYRDKHALAKIQKDLESALKESVKQLNKKVVDPVLFPAKRKLEANTKKIKKYSLRGDNRFVQMAICRLSSTGDRHFPDEYAYPEDIDHSQADVSLTAAVEEIEGYGDSSKNLLSYMFAKHHNIKENFKKPFKDRVLFNAARSPENPIYLSYIPSDLIVVGGESAKHLHAIYYVQCEKQPIGAMSVNTLTEKGE